jgi:hypothetical protein
MSEIRSSGLEKKSLTEIRGIASAIGLKVNFGDGKEKLVGLINDRMKATVEPPRFPPPLTPVDTRTMDAPPLHRCNRKQIEDALADFIRRGLVVTYPNEDLWHMKLGKREDSGPMRMPLRHIIGVARQLFGG